MWIRYFWLVTGFLSPPETSSGGTERTVTVINDGLCRHDGYFVSESYEDVRDIIANKTITRRCVMTKRKPYHKRPESDTNLKPHELARAGWYDVTMVVEVTRRLRIKALDEVQATFFAENRVRKIKRTG